MAARKSGGAKPKKPKVDGDSKILERLNHHESMADKHRAHADLIRAKLRTQGKEIRHVYPGDSPGKVASSKPTRKIVPATPDRY